MQDVRVPNLQVEGKSWARDEDIGALVRAFCDILPLQEWRDDPAARHDVGTIIAALLDMAD